MKSSKYLLAALSFFILSSCSSKQPMTGSGVSAATHMHPAYYLAKESYEQLFRQAGNVTSLTDSVVGGIVPHHLVAGAELAAFYASLNKQHPSVVVVIGPNHFHAGQGRILTTAQPYSTPYGRLDPDAKIIHNLSDNHLLSVEDWPFEREHSIFAEVGFIKRMWPDAKIVPIILKTEVTSDETRQLATALNSILPHDALVIASVDFSHYMPLNVADFHDQMSEAAIKNFNMNTIHKLEIDSAPSIELILRYLALRQAERVLSVVHSNSALLLGTPFVSETTSHLLMSFGNGEIASSKQISLMFFGDTIFARGVQSRYAQSGAALLSSIAGTEDRFFVGTDINVLNLEGPITKEVPEKDKQVVFSFASTTSLDLLNRMRIRAVNIANNHSLDAGAKGLNETISVLSGSTIDTFGLGHCMRQSNGTSAISICGFDDAAQKIDSAQAMKEVKNEKSKSDFVVASVHWGKELSMNITKQQKMIARALIDAGADAVIGYGPHVVQQMDSYKGIPIFYSIGNFLFDNPNPAMSSGLAIGLVFEKAQTMAYVYPLHTTSVNPHLYSADEQLEFYSDYLRNFSLNRDPAIIGKLIFKHEEK